MTRAELLERVEAEQRYWHGKSHMTPGNHERYRELMKIYYTYIPPEALLQDMEALRASLEGGGPLDDRFWRSRPCDDDPAAADVPGGQ